MKKISILTPTHNPKYINELWESIKEQTYQNFEWIILTNNNAKVDIKDERVRVIPFIGKTKSVGLLKKTCFGLATGEYLAEVDHDDLLSPDCLEKVVKEFEDESIGFVYSNNIKLSEKFVPYGPQYGWKWRAQKEGVEMISFEPSAGALAFIWYAPDHIRVWRKTVYDEIGGHDENLEICDDHDLMIRTYLKTKFAFINDPLYKYRIDGENTWLARNALIQTETVRLYKKYAYQLAERDAELNGLFKLDLGGAFGCPEGYIPVDKEGGQWKCDLDEDWENIPSNSVGVLRCHDIIEHLHDKQHFMSEAYRVLADGGWLMISVPSTDGRGAYQDPTHVSFWNENSFWYYTRALQAQYIHNDKIKFQAFNLETIFPSKYHEENKISYAVAYLRAVKSDKRRPHLQEI